MENLPVQWPRHMMVKLQVFNEKPHFGRGMVSLMLLVREGHSLRSACMRMGLAYSKAWRLLDSAQKDLGFTLLETRKGGAGRVGSRLTPQGEALLEKYLAFEAETRCAAQAIFEKYFAMEDKAEDEK